MYRLVGVLFLLLSALAGYTVSGGLFEIALINAVVYLVLALIVATLVAPKFGPRMLVYGMGGAFLISLLWPLVLLPSLIGPTCEGPDCEARLEYYGSTGLEELNQ